LELVLSWATLHFVGWVEPTPGFVGFRCTQPNLHFAGVIVKCETQQGPISDIRRSMLDVRRSLVSSTIRLITLNYH